MTRILQSIRGFLQSPGLTTALLVTIALGVGSNAALYGFARGLAPRRLPIKNIERIMSVSSRDPLGGHRPLTYDTVMSLKARISSFDLLGAARESAGSVGLTRGTTAVMAVSAVTPELAELLELPLNEGVVLSHRAWRDDFGGRHEIRGEFLRIDGVEVRVTDVAPDWLEGLYFGQPVDIWMLLDPATLQDADRNSRAFSVLGRLRSDASPRVAQQEVTSARVGEEELIALPYTGVTTEMAAGMSRVTTLLLAAATFVFLMACANVTSFLVSRASSRWHDTAVRVAIGARRRQLIQQLLSDGAVISLAGAAMGLLLAKWTFDVVPSLLFDQDAEQLVFSPSFAGIIAAAAACVGLTIACSVMPLFEIRDDDPAVVLRRESGGPSRLMRRLRSSLVVGQSACCCLLVISTGVLLDGFQHALKTTAGARLGTQILATIEAGHRFDRQELGLDYLRRAEDAAQSAPGVSSAALTGTIPGSRPARRPMRIDPPALTFRDMVLDVALFTPASLELISLPPIAGRLFGGGDSAQCGVVVVNKEAADALFAGDAVGRSIEDPEGQRVEIIGVVEMRRAGSNGANRPTVIYSELTGTPLDQVGPAAFRVPVASPPSRGVLDVQVVSASYFGAMDVAAAAGEVFGHRMEPGCHVGVLNQDAADLYFGGNAVGGAVIDGRGRRIHIMGVVRSESLRASQRATEPAMYLPLSQNFLPRMTIVLGTNQPGASMVASVRRRLDAVPGGRNSAEVTTLDAHLTRTALAPERIAAALVGLAAAIALALAAFGLHGAMTEFVRQRQREIALRLALGASGWRVVSLVFAEGLQLAGAGTMVGMIGSVLAMRWLGGTILALVPLPIWPWLAAPLMATVALAIVSVPAARAALTIDPGTLLRR